MVWALAGSLVAGVVAGLGWRAGRIGHGWKEAGMEGGSCGGDGVGG